MGLKPRPVGLPAQDRQLVTQHKDLQLLRPLAAPEQHNQLEQPADDAYTSDKPKNELPQDGLRRYRDINTPPSHERPPRPRPSFCTPLGTSIGAR